MSRPSAIAAAALAGILVAVAALAAQPDRPGEAADQALGMALMGATVSYSGFLSSGSGVVSSTRLEAGRYHLTFARDIADCHIVVSTQDAGVGRGYALTWLKSENHVDVVTCNPSANCNSAPADHSFELIAFCPR